MMCAQKKEICEEFVAAYRGGHRNFLGSDIPSQKVLAYKSHTCALLVSFHGRGSQLLISNDELTRYRYRPSSQDPYFEIQFGRKLYNASRRQGEFSTHATLEINSEQLAGPVTRRFIPTVTSSSFRSALFGLIGPIVNDDSEIESVVGDSEISPVGFEIECLVFKVRKGQLWIRHSQNLLSTKPTSAQVLDRTIADINCITVIKRAESEEFRFIDGFWHYQMRQCLQYGVYWAYGQPKRELAQNPADIEEGEFAEVSLRKEVGEGILSPPSVSWYKWPDHEWKTIVGRARRIETEKMACGLERMRRGEKMRLEMEEEEKKQEQKKHEQMKRNTDTELRILREKQQVMKQKAETEAKERAVEEGEEWLGIMLRMILLRVAVSSLFACVSRL